jgi:hypothetical protein
VTRPKKAKLPSADLVPIVGNGAIAGPVLEGVTVPVLILDTSTRPEIAEAIRVQAHVSPGDVRIQWGGLEGRPDDVILTLTFERPIEARAILRFSIEDEAILVEAALTARAIYLQDGRPGDRLMDDPDRPKMLVELPETGFTEKWNEMFLRRMTTVLSKKFGVPKRAAEPHARELIEQLRKLTTFRMPTE